MTPRPVGMTDTVHLRGGLVVSAEAFAVIISLEAREHQITVTRAGDLRVEPAISMTDQDRETVRRYKRELVAIVRYVQKLSAAPAMLESGAAARW